MFTSSLSRIMVGRRASGLYVDPDHLAGLLEVLGILGLSVDLLEPMAGLGESDRGLSHS